jgi:hypothetical protein
MDDVAGILETTAKELRSLQRHQCYLDGGISFREFWAIGDAIIEKLKAIPLAAGIAK